VPINDYDEDVKTKIIPFLLADIGEGIAEVEVLQWFVAPGDTVKQFDRICEVQSDKATVEITSRYDGIVDSIAQEEVIKVGTPLIYLRVDNEEGDNHAEDDAHMHNVDEEQDKLHIPTLPSSFSVPSEVQGDSQLRTQAKVLATPAVRKMSMDYGLDLRNIVGSGPKGRVLKADVLQLLRGSGRIEKEKSEQPSTNFPVSSTLQDETVPIRGYNRLMVKSMTESLSIPHMCYADEINMNQVLAARKALPDKKISVFPFCIKAASLAIRDYPIINSSLNLEEMTVTYKARHSEFSSRFTS
jgi:2-oxoisovalerate dehydrogenase E2 component (dihydrolipoyl transacylase)